VRGCLFTLIFAVGVIAVLVVVGLPAVYAGVITAGVGAAGLQADDTTVKVSSNPPTDLLGLHADTVHLTASDATFQGMDIGELDLTLGDVAILDRTVGSVDGELRGVTVDGIGGDPLVLDRISVVGSGEQITATTVVPKDQAEALISDAVEDRTGIRPRDVRLTRPDELVIEAAAGIAIRGRLEVAAGGDLVMRVDDGPLAGTPVVLLEGGNGLPIELTTVRVTDDGDLRLSGDLAISLLG
jgi:hypothetical protein